MKILITLTILVLSFISYYFFHTPDSIKHKTTHLEVKSLTVKSTKEKDEYNYISNVTTIKSIPTQNKTTFSTTTYLTLDDLQYLKTNKVISQNNYNQMIFQQLKTILQKASSTYYAKKHIVLNSSISAILTSQNAREKFKQSLTTDFGLDNETSNQALKKNRTVWDWVIFLSP